MKTKTKPSSKKIEPKELKPVIVKALPDRPLRVLAEFKQTSSPLDIFSADKQGAPPLAGWRCTAAWHVRHTDHEKKQFADVCADLGNVQILYHGTWTRHVEDIVRQGLRPGHSYCMFGSGIYMGPPAKAFAYCHPSRDATSQGAHYLLEVKAALGRVYEAPGPKRYRLSELQKMGFDSLAGVAGQTISWGGVLRHRENVVYSPDQVCILRIFEYQRIAPEIIKPRSGFCAVLRQTSVNLTEHNRTFKDLISLKPCGMTAAVEVELVSGERCWVCNECITRMRLKIGSSFEKKTEKGTVEKVKVKRVL